MPSNLLILSPLLLLPSIFPSIRVFSNKSVLCIRWPKYWSFGFSISASNAYSGLISFRINWFDLLADQETLGSLLQHHSSRGSVLSFLYSPTPHHTWLLEKPELWLDRPLSEKQCLCFLIHCLGLSWLFFQRASVFLISRLQSPSAVILEPKKIKCKRDPRLNSET